MKKSTTYPIAFSVFLYFILHASLFGQRIVEHFTVANTAGPGLSDGWIMDIDVSTDIIYVATRDGGLNYLYQGQWGVFTVNDGLPSEHVNYIAVDKNNWNLWIGTDLGFIIRSPSAVFPPHNLFPELSNIKSMVKDRNGDLWFGTYTGLYKHDGISLVKMYTDMDFKGRLLVLIDQNDNPWIGTEKDGLYHYNGSEWLQYDTGNGLSGTSIFCLGIDSGGNILVGTNSGLDIFDGANWKTKELATAILDIQVSAEGHVWVATTYETYRFVKGEWAIQDLGLNRYHRQPRRIRFSPSGKVIIGRHHGVSIYEDGRWIHSTPTIGLGGLSIFNMMTASDGKVWISCENRSLSVYDHGVWDNFNVYNDLNTNLVWDVAESSDGTTWVATNRGLRHFKEGVWTTIPNEGLVNRTVTGLLVENDSTIWASTFGGLCQWTNQSWQCMTITDGLVHNKIYAMKKDSQGNLWIGTDHGISRYNGQTWTNYTTENGLSHNRILTLFIDSKGWIWAGHQDGVDRWDGSTWTNYNEELNYQTVRKIMEIPKGRIWIGSNNLFYFDGEKFREFDLGIAAGDFILSFTIDDMKRLWVGTDKSGIYVLDQLSTHVKDDKVNLGTLKVYPNPVYNRIFIDAQKADIKPGQLHLYNLLGQLVLHQTIAGNQHIIEINVSHLSNGTYFISLHGDSQVHSGKIIIQN